MLIEDAGVLRSLRLLVSRMTRNWALREDLLQEALVHLWQQEMCRPGQCRSWYLQSCRFYLQNLLRNRRSIDSLGRRHESVSAFAGDGDSSEELPESHEEVMEAGAEESIFLQISAQDILRSLSEQLAAGEQTTLACLASGHGPSEIARALGVSHTSVIKQRRKIAALALKLGIVPLPQKPSVARKAKDSLPRRLAA